LIGEGVATVLSACEATGCPGVAALSCGNLPKVARAMRKRYPKANITILADIGPGQKKAQEAAKVIGGHLAVPDFGQDRPESASDFNDLALCRPSNTHPITFHNVSQPVSRRLFRAYLFPFDYPHGPRHVVTRHL